MSAPAIGTGRYIGQRVRRKEDPRLLTGRGQFVDDIALPGMLHVAFARSPIARGNILSIKTDVAREVPGVHAIYTQEDLARFKVDMMNFFFISPEIEITPLANGRVAYVGEPVALVIADSRHIAEDGAALVEIEYAEEEPVVTISDARRGPRVHPGTESNIAAEMGDEEIAVDLGVLLNRAPYLITHKVVHQRISQSPMETRGIVAIRDGSEELTLYITCQSPHLVARWTSLALGLPQTAIRVIAKDVGGGFGLKNHPWKEEVSVILAALRFGRPLKWVEDRYENLTAANQAREAEMVLQVAFDADGRLIASHGDYSCNNGAYPQLADCNIAVQMFLWAAYKMPAYGFLARGWYTNTVGLAAYRGPWAMESLIRETALDVAARRIGIDPIEIRRRNLIMLKDQPTTSCMGIPLDDITPAECLDKLLEHFDVAAFRKEQEAARKEGRYLGLGIAAYIEPTGSAGSITTMTGELAQVRIEPTGKITATMSTHSQGHGTATTMAQIIAERLCVAYEDVTVFEGDSSRGGFSPGAAGSRQGVIAGGAAIMASDLLVAKVKLLAGHLLNVSPEAIRIDDGMLHVEGEPEKSRTLRSIAEIAYGEPDRLPPGFEAGLEAQYRYQPPPMTLASAANACVVDVDPETGFVKILRWICAEDCGTAINPTVVEGQIAGGLAQAIGMVLLEEMAFDAQGNPTAATYKDYLLPAISDIPDFEFLHANTPSKSVGGMRGVGEGGAIIGSPTLINAIADALAPFGEVPVDLPLTPGKLLSIIEGRNIAGGAHKPEGTCERAVAGHGLGDGIESPHAAAASAQAAGTAAPAKAPIDGDWNMVLATPMGPKEMTGHFETDGQSLSGYLSSPEGRQAFTGIVEGNRLKFDLKVEKPMKITLKYDIAVEGHRLAGKVKMGIFGSAKLSGERA
jgi:carbon-monoxide dehydrogenase large subunit